MILSCRNDFWANIWFWVNELRIYSDHQHYLENLCFPHKSHDQQDSWTKFYSLRNVFSSVQISAMKSDVQFKQVLKDKIFLGCIFLTEKLSREPGSRHGHCSWLKLRTCSLSSLPFTPCGEGKHSAQGCAWWAAAETAISLWQLQDWWAVTQFLWQVLRGRYVTAQLSKMLEMSQKGCVSFLHAPALILIMIYNHL